MPEELSGVVPPVFQVYSRQPSPAWVPVSAMRNRSPSYQPRLRRSGLSKDSSNKSPPFGFSGSSADTLPEPHTQNAKPINQHTTAVTDEVNARRIRFSCGRKRTSMYIFHFLPTISSVAGFPSQLGKV